MSVIVTYIGERMRRKTRIEYNEINFESILFLLTDSCLGNRRQRDGCGRHG